jgi:hypothetical protein
MSILSLAKISYSPKITYKLLVFNFYIMEGEMGLAFILNVGGSLQKNLKYQYFFVLTRV